MYINIPWKDYSDSWNLELFNLDNSNKIKFSELINNNSDLTKEKNHNIESEIYNDTHNFSTILSLQEMLDIINISDFKINNLSDIFILKNLIKVIGWCINNCNSSLHKDNYLNYLDSVKWITATIKYFMNELNIKELQNKQFNCKLIRSSYKLCPQKNNCIFQYPDNIKSNNSCRYQHYPYASLYIDCSSIVQYIEYHFSSHNSDNSSIIKSTIDTEFNISELKRCLTTINYVIMIMFRELDIINKYRHTEPNYDIRKYHAYYIPFKFNDNKKNQQNKTIFRQKY